MLPFASVHPWARCLVAGLALVVGGLALVRGLSRRRLKPAAALAFGLLGLAGLLAGLTLVLPVAPEAAWSGELATPVQAALVLAGSERRPLALDPHRGLMEWGSTLGWLALAGGTALVVRNSRRGRRVLRVALGTGIGLVLLALFHRLAGLETVYGSGLPEFARDPFLGPFINPNHGGIFCAALVPLGMVELRREGGWRLFGAASLVALAVGIALSGSRGAVLACGASLMPLALVEGGRRARLALGVLSILAVAGALVLGPVDALRLLSEAMAPSSLMEGQDVFTGRGPMYEDALRVAGAALWTGVGPHGFDDAFEVLKTSPDFTYTAHAHQELIQLVAEQGLPLALVWLAGLGVVLWRGLSEAITLDRDDRRRQLVAWAGVLSALAAASMFTFPLRVGALQALGALGLGLMLGLSESSERGRRSLVPSVAATGLSLLAALGLAGPWAANDSGSIYGSPELARSKAQVLLDGGRVDQGVEALRLALARKPVERLTLQALSPALVRQLRIEAAVEALRVATRVEPTSPWVWRDLARLQRRMGDYDPARETWQRALWCDLPDRSREPMVREALLGPGDPRHIAELALPERGDVLSVAGRVVEQEGELELAEELLRRAWQKDPRYGAHLSAALLRWDRPEDALVPIEGLDSCFALESRAQALTELDRLDEAEQAWLVALDTCKDEAARHRRIRIGLARLRLAQDDPRGRELVLQLVAEDPADAAAWRSLLRDARADRNRPVLLEALRGLESSGLLTPKEAEQLRKLEAGFPLDEVL